MEFINGAWQDVPFDPDNIDARALLEAGARVACLDAETLVDIVFELAPSPSAEEGRDYMMCLAEMALEDFQRIPTRGRIRRLAA